MNLEKLHFYISPDHLPPMDVDPPTYILKVIGLINDYKVPISRTFYTEDSEDGLYLKFVDEEMETIKFILKRAGSKIVGQLNMSVPNLYESKDNTKPVS